MKANAKQHILTLKCVKYSPISEQTRARVAKLISHFNHFVIQEEQLQEIDEFLCSTDEVFLRAILQILGGCVLGQDFKILSLNSFLSR